MALGIQAIMAVSILCQMHGSGVIHYLLSSFLFAILIVLRMVKAALNLLFVVQKYLRILQYFMEIKWLLNV